MLRHVFMILGAALMLGTTTPAAASHQADPADPLVVAESFLLARNARDPMGATGFCSPQLVIQDGQDRWIADEPASRDWFRRLTDTYAIDMLVHPRAEGERVVWVERLAPRSLPFPQALQQSLEVQVEVVVQDGKITSYTAPYPVLAPQPLSGAAFLNEPVVPPAVAVFGSALALAAVLLLAINASSVVRRTRRSAPGTQRVQQSRRFRIGASRRAGPPCGSGPSGLDRRKAAGHAGETPPGGRRDPCTIG